MTKKKDPKDITHDPKAPRKKRVLSAVQLKLFEELASCGCSLDDIVLEVSAAGGDHFAKTTLRARMNEDPALKALYKEARSRWKNEITRRLKVKTLDNESPENTSLLIFTAKTQLRWSEPKEEIPQSEYSIIVRRTPLKAEEEKEDKEEE